MKKQIISEEVLKMQKIAGIITESQFKEAIFQEEDTEAAGKPEIGAEILYISSSMGKQKAKVVKYGKNYKGEDTVILEFPDKNNQRLEVDANLIKKEASGWVAR